MPETSYLLACLECGDPEKPLIMPFASAEERGKWSSEHRQRTSHDRWWVRDDGGMSTPDAAYARVAEGHVTASGRCLECAAFRISTASLGDAHELAQAHTRAHGHKTRVETTNAVCYQPLIKPGSDRA